MALRARNKEKRIKTKNKSIEYSKSMKMGDSLVNTETFALNAKSCVLNA
ncbi:MAG: hypothetical protein ACYCZO_03205 [Daejeonella sp.]